MQKNKIYIYIYTYTTSMCITKAIALIFAPNSFPWQAENIKSETSAAVSQVGTVFFFTGMIFVRG